MARTVPQSPTRVLKDGIADLAFQFAMPGQDPGPPLSAAVDPDNIVAADAHYRMLLVYNNGRGTGAWLKVTDAPSLSAQQKTDLRTIAKLLRDDAHAAIGATGTADDP